MAGDERALLVQVLMPSLISPRACLLLEDGPQAFAMRAAVIYD